MPSLDTWSCFKASANLFLALKTASVSKITGMPPQLIENRKFIQCNNWKN